ncbi:DUF4266 domain-containing protein [bacterium]|nr:DUF4266 domain-containing protein [bacterium]
MEIRIWSRRAVLAGMTVLLAGGATGCANMGVKPWERDLLAKPGMQIDSDPVVTALDEHIYFSKEASTGGLGTAGGGCGCN